MKSTIIAVGALLLATASAQPHGHNQRRHERHAPAKRDVVWVTDIVDVVETVQLTATVWVDENGNTVSPVLTGTFTATGSPSTSVHAGIFNEPAPTSTVVLTTSSTSTSSTSTSTSTPVVVETPTPTTTAAASTTTIQVSSVTPSSASVAPVAAVVATPVVAAAAQASSTSASVPVTAASSTGSCASGSACTGDITYYTAGMGACGTVNNGDTDMIVALPHEFMGAQSNGNPYCGKSITIKKGAATIIATVADKCMGCKGRDLDLSNIAFQSLGLDFGVGRTTADWWFN